jgi:hypothetical protein
MTDYLLGIGGPNVMMIRDTGGWVEFWFKTGSQTWNNDQWWSYAANGGGSRQKYRLVRGGNWQMFGSVWVGYDQDVRFTIEGAGLGWGTTDFWQHIQRSTVPQAPTLNSVAPISQSGFRVISTLNYDGGSAIVERQLGYGSSSNGPSSTTPLADGDEIVGGFSTGQRLYFWVRARNALGWSGWSNRGEATTWQVPAAPAAAIFTSITQRSVGVNFPFTVRSSDPPNLEKQFKYGRDPTGAIIDATVNVDETIEYLSNLDPGKTYYFWARARNSVGWGPWTSTASRLILIAGSRVLVAGQWKRAVPYVRVGGVWKVAEPWIKDVGVWKRTSL